MCNSQKSKGFPYRLLPQHSVHVVSISSELSQRGRGSTYIVLVSHDCDVSKSGITTSITVERDGLRVLDRGLGT